MIRNLTSARALSAVLLTTAALAACGKAEGGEKNAKAPAVRTLTLGAYTTPREVYHDRIIPAFQEYWRRKTGQEVKFEESYLGSGAQARAIKEGFEADVAALSLDPDIQTLVDAGLVQPDWKGQPHGGMVSRSVVVIGVRPGNPKNLHDWADLARPDVDVLTPSPRTSGGAMWNVAAIYGSTHGDTAAAERLLSSVVNRVKVMDKGARESMITFESAVGDAVLTYENEVLVARKAGRKIDFVTPRSTILIENPVAVVGAYADKHHVRDVADEFVRFLATPEVQRMYAEYGLRPVDEKVAAETAAQYPAVPGLFTIADLGGWPRVKGTLFAQGGAFDRASTRLAGPR
jgi:sulfate transport system substrate-binding protein